jgi:hypothetical protein
MVTNSFARRTTRRKYIVSRAAMTSSVELVPFACALGLTAPSETLVSSKHISQPSAALVRGSDTTPATCFSRLPVCVVCCARTAKAGHFCLAWHLALQWRGMQWRGMQWRGMQWRGMQWRGMQWRGMQWRGMQWRVVATKAQSMPTVRASCISRCRASRATMALYGPAQIRKLAVR